MTDKEPIIIDGIDVSVCKYLPYCNDKQGNCAYEPNCYFKKLAHKTQECEKYKASSESLQDIADELQKRNHFLTLDNERLTQECKKLDEVKSYLGINDESVLERLKGITGYKMKKELECNCYRDTLEEIERVVIPLANKNLVENCWSLLDTCKKCKSKKECGNQSPYTRVKQILDIINKVKEEQL